MDASSRTWPPGRVYFTEFVSRLMRSWRRRTASPTNTSSSSGMTTSKAWAFCSHCGPMTAAARSKSTDRRNGSLVSTIFPLSIFEMSSTSLMRLSRWSDAAPIFRRLSSVLSASSVCSFAICSMPMMAFIGVRISWLMRERNSDFAWLAASAAVMASFMDSCSSFSVVTSRSTTRMRCLSS